MISLRTEPWILFCSLLTVASLLVSILLGAKFSSDQIILLFVFALGAVTICFLVAMSRRSHARSVEALQRVIIAIVFGSLNLLAFSAIKHDLNGIAFTWDVTLRAWDQMLFGVDPIAYLTWLPDILPRKFYHWSWLFMILCALVFCAGWSKERNTIMPLYFLCWTVFGPIIHIMMPAAGPIFFERLGLGDDFSHYKVPAYSQHWADKLWAAYVSGEPVVGSGISAMPSLHVMTTAWIVLVFRKTPLFIPALIWGLLVFAMSIATGWHYAVDGLVSIALIVISYLALARFADRGAPKQGSSSPYIAQRRA